MKTRQFSPRRPSRILALVLVLTVLLSALSPFSQAGAAFSEPEPDLASAITAQPAILPADGQKPDADADPGSAYVRDVALDDGRRAVLVSSEPLNYRADDGSWQPIEARFAAVPGGFLNRENVLEIGAGERQATLKLKNGTTPVGWEPRALLQVLEDGTAVTLSQVLAADEALPGELSADGRTVRYGGSWTMAGLVEEVTAGPGQVEQSLVLEAPPHAAGNLAAEGTLAFQAVLHLFPGSGLYADGAVQTAAFQTSGTLEVRDAAGQVVLQLLPPRAFEQARPGIGVAASYRLEPRSEGEWLVSVETPVSWWAAPERSYPVVLDPTMQVLRAFDAVSVYTWAIPCPVPVYPDDNPAPAVHVGDLPGCSGSYRALVRFTELPTLPPGAQLEDGELLVAAVRGFYPKDPSGEGLIGNYTNADVRRITSDWDPSTVSWGTYSVEGTPLGTAFFSTPEPGFWAQTGQSPTYEVNSIPLPASLLNDWYGGQNYGLELRSATEGVPCGDTWESREDSGCRFASIPIENLWSEDDLDVDPSGSKWRAKQGGFMLKIPYTPPALQDGVTLTYDTFPTGGGDYVSTAHTYDIPDSSSTWNVVAVKGMQEYIVSATQYLASAGNFALERSWGEPYDQYNYAKVRSDPAFPNKPNYIVTRGNPNTYNYHAGILPLDPYDSANDNLDFYMIESRSSTALPGNPTMDPYTLYTHTLTMRSDEIVRIFDLNLVADTRVRIDVDAEGIYPGQLGLRLYPPTLPNVTLPKETGGVKIAELDSHRQIAEFTTGPSGGGTWAAVLEYTGDVTWFSTNGGTTWGETPRSPVPQADGPITFEVTIIIRACNLNAVPVEGPCRCQVAARPDASTPRMDVGPYRIYSPDGFTQHPSTGQWSTVESCEMPFIGNASTGNTTDLTGLAEGTISFYAAPDPLGLNASGKVYLVDFSPGTATPAMLALWRGYTYGHPNPGANQGWLTTASQTLFNLPLHESDQWPKPELKVYIPSQYAQGDATLQRTIETSPGHTEDMDFDLTWIVTADGYDVPFDYALTYQSGPSSANVGSLTYHFGTDWIDWSIDFDNQNYADPGQFSNLRNQGIIVQSPEMGSNWGEVQALILAPGKKLPAPKGGLEGCLGGYCLDIRAPDDSVYHENRQWDMPDVEVTDLAQTVILSQPGELTVYSTDHPSITQAGDLPFSFRSFQGNVHVEKGICPTTPQGDAGSSGEKVLVISGTTNIALPGLGSGTNPDMMVGASFILCQNKLRQVSLTFRGPPPGLPVGSTGVFVRGLSGKITIDPEYTQVEFGVDYASGPTGNLTDGTATVTVDTRGLFDIQAKGNVLAKVDYRGHVWVAWNPLDVGVDVEARFPDWNNFWLRGQVYAHLWKGRGWQGKYDWLPDNDETHFAGSIKAELRIKKGQAFSWWWIDIPPCTITRGIEVAFGQFCGKGCSCSCYEWGFKGKMSIIGYDVGIYYGLDSGFSFILGSDKHVLIDQYKGLAVEAAGPVSAVPLVNGEPVPFNRRTVADPLAPEQTIPLTITAQTDSAVVGLTWENAAGSPDLTLLHPDGQTVIDPGNAASYGISVTDTPTVTIYGLPSPAEGIWHALISNADPQDNYHLAFFANRAMPEVQFTAPVTPGETWPHGTPYPISWTVPPNPDGLDLRIGLYYSVTQSGALSPSQQYGGVIVENLPLSDGTYDWDTSYLGSGLHHVYARISSGGEPYLPTPTITGTDQLPGVAKIWAGGSINIHDTIGPVAPDDPFLIPLDEAVAVCWTPNADHDLAGYLLFYAWYDYLGDGYLKYLRVHASVPNPAGPTDPPWECARVGGLNTGNYFAVIVAAYDASGNIGSASNEANTTVVADLPNSGPESGTLSGHAGANHSAVLSWTGVQPPGTAYAYEVHYAQDWPAGPGQPGTGATTGPSPIWVPGTTTGITLDGLTPGHLYSFVVRAYDPDARVGPLTNRISFWLTDGVDDDGDGLPDDWEDAYDLDDPLADEDGDGLSNEEEYDLGLIPIRDDDDNDGYSDEEERRAGTDPWDSHDLPLNPIESRLPRLHVEPRQLTIRQGTADPSTAWRLVRIENHGFGDLETTFSSSSSRLSFQPVASGVWVGVNLEGLPAGFYSEAFTVTGSAGTQDSPQRVDLDIWRFTGRVWPYPIYLPLLLKNPVPRANLALGRPVAASGSDAAHGPENAVDGDSHTWWGSGGDAPQWIEVDLQEQYAVSTIQLKTWLPDPGHARHRVWGRGADAEAYQLLCVLEGDFQDDQALQCSPGGYWNGLRYLRIETTASPSGAGWREIIALGWMNYDLGENLALGRSASASSALPGEPAAQAVDGDLGTAWNAGDDAPQWIEIDLKEARTIRQVVLHTNQYPAGNTMHRVWGRAEMGEYVFLAEFNRWTDGGERLTYTPAIPWEGYRWIRVETVASPSWVAWSEVEVIGE